MTAQVFGCVLFYEKSTKSAGGLRISPGPLKTPFWNVLVYYL